MTNLFAAGAAALALGRMAVMVACCPPSSALLLPVCGEPGHFVSIPLKGGKPAGDDQPAGCHAMCGRKFAERLAEGCPDC